MSDLSILMVTRGEAHVLAAARAAHRLAATLDAELVLVLDGERPRSDLLDGWSFRRSVASNGDIGSVLDAAVEVCERDFILRLDDDERASPGMMQWLERRTYRNRDHWKFGRANLWGDESHHLVTPELWPDWQTRLSLKRYSGGRKMVHAGSPFGGGERAPVAIEHHKFLLKSIDERRAIIKRYESIQPGAGSGFIPWSVPEDHYSSEEIARSTRFWDGWWMNP